MLINKDVLEFLIEKKLKKSDCKQTRIEIKNEFPPKPCNFEYKFF